MIVNPDFTADRCVGLAFQGANPSSRSSWGMFSTSYKVG